MSKWNRDESRKRNKKKIFISDKEKWLICCEGQSEVYYLLALVNDLAQGSLHNIHFGVTDSLCTKRKNGLCGVCGRQGNALVERAELCAIGGGYKKIWVVFDEDGETTAGAQADKRKDFCEAILKWNRMKSEGSLIEIAWNKPKFENWLLLSKEGLSKSGIDKAEDDVKAALYKYHEADPNRGPVPKAKQALIKKPYPKSYQAFGGLEGAKTAARRAEKYYIANGIEEREKSGKFSDLPFGSNFYRLVWELFRYFDRSI